MIKEIDFENIKKSETFKYAEKLEFFQKNKKVEFKPGLNILFAPNGTGKSTILKILAQATASEQGGISTLTDSWRYEVFGFGDKNKLDGINIVHDGQPTLYTNPRVAVGLVGGGAGFDDEFFDQGIQATMSKDSTGLTTIGRIGRIIQTIAGDIKMPKEIEKRIKLKPEQEEFLKPQIEIGQQTIILDEPESGVAIHVQQKLWQMIEKGAKEQNLQIIVATHSPFALACNANFIELHPGYVEMSKLYIQALGQELEKDIVKEKSNKQEVEEKNNSTEEPIKTGKKKLKN